MVKKIEKHRDFSSIIQEEFGDILPTKTDENSGEPVKAISTGSVSLDISTGIGGIPLGRFTELYGPDSSGKTTLSMEICSNAIKQGHRVLYIDAENTLDIDYAREIIKDMNDNTFVLIQPELMEQSMRIAELAINDGDFNLIVLDSIGSLAPKKVKEDELTSSNVALLSRFMTTFLQRNAYNVRKSNIAFLGVNQVRDKIGAYISTFETPGGHAWKHITSLRIQLSRATDIEQDGTKIGIMSRFVIKKNKLAPPYRSFTIPIIFGKGVDTTRDAIEFASMLSIMEKRGPYFAFGGETLASGMNKTIEYLNNNKETLDKIIKACYDTIDNKNLDEEGDELNGQEFGSRENI